MEILFLYKDAYSTLSETYTKVVLLRFVLFFTVFSDKKAR